MPKNPVFDTSLFSPYKNQIEPQIPSTLFRSIVFYELTAINIDEGTLKKYELWRKTLAKIDRVLTPRSNEWWETAKSGRPPYIKKTISTSKLRTLQGDPDSASCREKLRIHCYDGC